MFLPKSGPLATRFTLLGAITLSFVTPAFAQGWAPAPGAPAPTGGGAPAGSATTMVIPASALNSYTKLPLNPGMAAGRLEELRASMQTSSPKQFQDAIAEYCDWLSDMADAHWKLSQTFAKDPSTKNYAESEKNLCVKFGQLKRQAMLVKAQFLVNQRRYPEALSPLVDIVTAEPKSDTGQTAYKILRDIGFSNAQLP